MTPTGDPAVVRLWVARSDSNDFRESKWESQVLTLLDGAFNGTAPKNGDQRVAVFWK